MHPSSFDNLKWVRPTVNSLRRMHFREYKIFYFSLYVWANLKRCKHILKPSIINTTDIWAVFIWVLPLSSTKTEKENNVMNISKVKASTVHIPEKKNNTCLNKTLVFRFSSDYLTEWPRFLDTVVKN